MNKKIFLIVVLSLMSNNLLYGEDSTEKIIRKNDTFFRGAEGSGTFAPLHQSFC